MFMSLLSFFPYVAPPLNNPLKEMSAKNRVIVGQLQSPPSDSVGNRFRAAPM